MYRRCTVFKRFVLVGMWCRTCELVRMRVASASRLFAVLTRRAKSFRCSVGPLRRYWVLEFVSASSCEIQKNRGEQGEKCFQVKQFSLAMGELTGIRKFAYYMGLNYDRS